MSRTEVFFDQQKPKKMPIRDIRRFAGELNEKLSNRTPYEGPSGTAITNQKFGRSSGSNN